MKFKKLYLLFLAVLFFSFTRMQAQTTGWPPISRETKPWTRWWWMGSAVNLQEVKRELAAFAEAGIGGVEIVPIYGAAGYEQQCISYLSPAWKATLYTTIQQANDLGLGVDLSVGSGWPIGGPQVGLQHAATKLIIQEYNIERGDQLPPKIILHDSTQRGLPGTNLAALVAYDEKGAATDITAEVAADGTLHWQPAKGSWKLIAAFGGKTKQQVKRSAPGGNGYVLDYFSKNGVQHYLQYFQAALGNSTGLRAVFNDSYEAWGTDWTEGFLELFAQKRGYSLKPFLHVFRPTDTSAVAGRIKADYRATLSELLLDHFAKPYGAWARQNGNLATNQAHGSPANLLDIYAAADIPEGETFGPAYFPIPGLRRDSTDIPEVAPDPVMLKFASSAAHVTGKKLVSNETFTWLTEHFKTSWAQCKPTAEMAFLAGINHIFFHGSTYSPNEAPWPGWLFYASVAFVPANSLWDHIGGLTSYISRCQSVLQWGRPDNDLALYWPVYDNWQNAQGRDMPFRVHDMDKWLHPTQFYRQATTLQQAGYSMDFVSDNMVLQASLKASGIQFTLEGASYKVLVIPACTYMPLATVKQLMALADSGATVVWQQLPKDVPGFLNHQQQAQQLRQIFTALPFTSVGNGVQACRKGRGRLLLSANLQAALEYAGVPRETLVDAGLQFIRRKSKTGTYYYIVNHTTKAIDQFLPINAKAASVLLLDPLDGAQGIATTKDQNGKTSVRLQLKSGATAILQTIKEAIEAPRWQYLQPAGNPIILNRQWQLQFKDGGPVKPKDTLLQQLSSWTLLDSSAAYFSGKGVYTTTFMLDQPAPDYLLQLGTVHESAKVYVNGQYAGLLWSIPFEQKIGKYLRKGKNTISVEVANLMANRVRYMDRKGIAWRRFHDINFVNIQYKSFDASRWEVEPSGLTGPVMITPLKGLN